MKTFEWIAIGIAALFGVSFIVGIIVAAFMREGRGPKC